MQKFVQYLFVLFFVACIAACGGSGTTTATVVYDHPTTLAPLPSVSNPLMGGAVQGTPLVLGNPVTVSTLAGMAGTAALVDGSGAAARFYQPDDITYDNIGKNFYVADHLNSAIRKVTPGGVVTTLHCTLADGITPIGFLLPSGITTDGINLYVVDTGSNTVRVIKISTNVVTAIIGSTIGLAGSFDSTVPALVLFNQPTGITTDGVNLYVTDTLNQTVRRIVIATGAVSTLAGVSGSIGSFDGFQGFARFYLPNRITTDGTNLYLTDLNNRSIRLIEILTGIVTTIAGSPGPVATTDGIGAIARFDQPNGITTDGKFLYVTDFDNNTLRMIDKSAPYNVTTIPMPAGSLHTPYGITTDGVSLFVADTFILNPDNSFIFSNSILRIQ